MRPWDHRVPPFLYKYLHTDRFHVLTSAKVRFSQRTAFDDDHELQPRYVNFGTEDEIRRYLALDTGFQTDQGIDLDAFIQLFASSAELQERAQITAQGAMKSPNEFGVFCLTDAPDSEQMWQEYADNGRGFVISFDTAHPGFSLLTSPGRLGKVDYSDKPFGTFLGTFFSEGAGVFYRKRMKYAFENEWRSIRGLHRLERCRGDIYLSQFDPQCVKKIIIRVSCCIEMKLRHFLAVDARYSHVRVEVQR